MKFVIADDEPLVRSYLRSLVLDASIGQDIAPPVEAKDGAELVEIFRKGEADAAFVDIRMPKLDGLEAMRKLRSEGITPPWFVLSSHSDFSYAKTALSLGAAGYALKPPAPDEIADAVRTLKLAVDRQRVGREDVFARDWTYFVAGISDTPPTFGRATNATVGILAFDPVPQAETFANRSEIICRAIRDRASRYSVDVVGSASAPTRMTGRIAVAVLGFSHSEAPDGKLMRFLNEAFMAAENAKVEKGEERGRAVLIVDHCGQDLSTARETLSKIDGLLRYRPIIPTGTLDCKRVVSILSGFSAGELAAAAAASFVSEALSSKDGAALRRGIEGLSLQLEPRRLSEKAERGILRFFEKVLPRAVAAGRLDRAALEDECLRRASVGLPENDTIESVIKYLERHFRERVSVASVARSFGLTPNYLSSLFHRRVGETFIERLTSLRMEKARELLRSGKQVKETAWAVGYGNERHFSRLYRKRFGRPPADEKRGGSVPGKAQVEESSKS